MEQEEKELKDESEIKSQKEKLEPTDQDKQKELIRIAPVKE